MARIYAHKKGKSGSTKPVRTSSPSWVRYSPEEVAQIALKLNKQGLTPSQVGLALRDTYGIPSVRLITGKPLVKILEDAGSKLDYPEDLMALMKRAVRIRKHLVTYKTDKHSGRGLSNTEMKILRLVKYYKKTGKIPKEWKYNPAKAALIVSGR